jgi:2-polyprenyl-3-methyl-5-hydroxy-6-metoxy-1,4-benzoquinol methylase
MAAPTPAEFRAPRPARTTDLQIEGLSGPATLRKAAGGYWQVWPRPDPSTLRELYREHFYQEDKASYLAQLERDREDLHALWSLRRRSLEERLAAGHRRLLDVGCGGGFLLDHFRAHGWQVSGIEPSPVAVEFARERFGIDVFCGELLDYAAMDEADGGFDAIHCAQVLEHVLDPEACVARITDLLAPGGVAFIEVPNDFSPFQQLAREQLDLSAWWVAPDHHLNYFDFESLSAMLRRHGLQELDRLASFPMELFLLMGDDYVGDPPRGPECHARRLRFESAFTEGDRLDILARFYRSLARAGLGRTCGLLVGKSVGDGSRAGNDDPARRGGR